MHNEAEGRADVVADDEDGHAEEEKGQPTPRRGRGPISSVPARKE
jgi:hypothetical protein